jgi:hypothetical protein
MTGGSEALPPPVIPFIRGCYRASVIKLSWNKPALH